MEKTKEAEIVRKGRVLLPGYIMHLLAFACFSYVFCLMVFKPLSDPDLWWHLKTGELTLKERALPSGDPFTYTSPDPFPEGQNYLIASQWMGQVLFYFLWKIGGYKGLSTFRALLIVMPFVACYVVFVRRGLGGARVLALLGLPLLIILIDRVYTFERPQAFSFFLAFCLVSVLMSSMGGRLRTLLLVCIMALWSNLHGAFVIGILIILAYCGGLLLNAVLYRETAFLKSLPPAVLGVLGSLMNPNSYRLTYELLRGYVGHLVRCLPFGGSMVAGPPVRGQDVSVMDKIFEYKSLWAIYRDFHYVEPLFIIAFLAVSAFVFIMSHVKSRRADFSALTVFVFLTAFALYITRGATFALMALPALVLPAIERYKGRMARALPAVAAFALSAALFANAARTAPWKLELQEGGWIDASYPSRAVEFIKDNNIRGPMFNDMKWGGFLAWKLFPDYRVFIDGRLAYLPTSLAYLGVHGGQPGWRSTLDSFGVNFILLQVVSLDIGRVTPLILNIIEERPAEWKLVFLDGNTALFVRDTKQNKGAIMKYRLPIEILYGTIYDVSRYTLGMRPGDKNSLLSMAVALYWLGRPQESGLILVALPPSTLRDRYIEMVRRTGVRGVD